jgi:predicted ribosome quality control (RQC) complex YloA/Tae2 family protein
MMVDVTIGNVQYSFKDASEVGYTTNLVISPNRACVLREVKNHKTNNETQISMTPRLQEELPKLDVVIEELEPELKEKKEQDAKLAKLAEEIQSMKQMFEQALKQMSNGSKRVDTEI